MRLSAAVACLYVALRIVIWATLFLLLFAGMTWFTAVILSWCSGTPVAESRNLYLGMICALVAWLFLAVFHLRWETRHLPFANRDTFLRRVKTVLGELGYEVMIETPTHVRFHPSFRSFLMGGGVLVKMDETIALVSGPRLSLEMLRKRLRLYQRLAAVHQSAGDVRRRQPDNRLKRVQIDVRLPADRWPEVMDHLVGVLGEEASLICDLHILAQSTAGLRESTIEEQIRAWLHDRGIPAEIHKNHVQLAEPGTAVPAEISEEIPL